MASELTHRNQSHQPHPPPPPPPPPPLSPGTASTSPPSRSRLVAAALHRVFFVFVGIGIATLFFHAVLPKHSPPPLHHPHVAASELSHRRILYEAAPEEDDEAGTSLAMGTRHLGSMNAGGKVPLGLKRKGLRIVVTGGAGFVGSHLVDRLIARGDSVIVVDNFFTGRKENVAHHFGNARFELIRHDVVEPILLEVDQIYHLACPASPVHYKFNPVKTIISFSAIHYYPFNCNPHAARYA
ncbi:hypothetical protein NL676_020745 [Syzygium grande]|nr:hypothetical protein NL676_020745 [Syzygium grande]